MIRGAFSTDIVPILIRKLLYYHFNMIESKLPHKNRHGFAYVKKNHYLCSRKGF